MSDDDPTPTADRSLWFCEMPRGLGRCFGPNEAAGHHACGWRLAPPVPSEPDGERWPPSDPPPTDRYLPLEQFVAGAISTLPPFDLHHPGYALPHARQAIEAIAEFDPPDADRPNPAPAAEPETTPQRPSEAMAKLREAQDRLTAASARYDRLADPVDDDARAEWLTAIGILRVRVNAVLSADGTTPTAVAPSGERPDSGKLRALDQTLAYELGIECADGLPTAAADWIDAHPSTGETSPRDAGDELGPAGVQG